MKIAISGDLHLKIKNETDLFKIKLYNKLFNIYCSYPVVILAGDIFDKKPNELEVAFFIQLLNLGEQKGTQFYIIEGNHDYSNRYKYLKTICDITLAKNLYYPDNNTQLSIYNEKFSFVHNSFIRYGGTIKNNKGILISHIACDLPFYKKKEEYPLSTLNSYDFVFLGDIHNYYYLKNNIYYTSSPYRIHRKTISSLKEIDNSFFGFIEYNGNGSFNKIELNLPNQYICEGDKEEYDGEDEIIWVNKGESILDAFSDIYTHITPTNTIEYKTENFLEVVSQCIYEYTGEDPKRYLAELQKLGVINEDK